MGLTGQHPSATIPDSVEVPRIGTLRYELGFPTQETSRKLFDEMDFQRAVQIYLWGYPAVSFESIRLTAKRDLGMDFYWLLGGLLTIRWALGVRWRAGARIGLAAGVLGTGAGLILLARSTLDDVVDPSVLIGIVALTTAATGCLRLVGAFELEEHTGHRWTIGGLILGSVEVVLGIILFVARDTEASTIRVALGAWGLIAGSLLLVQGARMLRIRRMFRLPSDA